MTRTALITTVFLATLFAPARPARAAEVSASVSSREVFVDLPFTLQVAIENARDREEPQLPQLIGVNVLGDPSERSSSFTQIINGRMTQRETVTLSYRLVATRAGPFTIGPITVVADGKYTWNHKESGGPCEVRMAHVWTLADGKATAFLQHVDSATVRELIK